MQSPAQALKKVIDASRKWAVSRGKLRATLDSKSSTAEAVEKAKKVHIDDATQLEIAVLEFEKLYRHLLQRSKSEKKSEKRPKKPFPWKQALGVVAKGTAVLDRAINQEPIRVQARVVDTEGETVP